MAGFDFDGDGFQDLAVLSLGAPTLTVLLSPGAPGAALNRQVEVALEAQGHALVAGDVDGDGHGDVVVSTRNGIELFVGDAGGEFTSRRTIAGFGNAESLVLGYLDEDGLRDLLFVHESRVFVARRFAESDAPAPEQLLPGVDARLLELSDIDRNGYVDLVVANEHDLIAVRDVERPGGSQIEKYPVTSLPRDILLSDLDRDRATDCVLADFRTRTVTVFFGNIPMGSDPRTLRRGDADLDGVAGLSDAVAILSALFLGGPTLRCGDAADVNDDAELTPADPVRLLSYLFLGGPPVPAPGPETCGEDPTEDPLGCDGPCP
jgi:hypothetical protein